VYSGSPQEWIERLDRLIARYGSNALFLYFSPMEAKTADLILNHAHHNWRDVSGNYKHIKR